MFYSPANDSENSNSQMIHDAPSLVTIVPGNSGAHFGWFPSVSQDAGHTKVESYKPCCFAS